MVKQPRLLLDKYDPALVGCLMNRLIIDGAAWSRNVLGSRLMRTEDIVDERELDRASDFTVSQGDT